MEVIRISANSTVQRADFFTIQISAHKRDPCAKHLLWSAGVFRLPKFFHTARQSNENWPGTSPQLNSPDADSPSIYLSLLVISATLVGQDFDFM